MSLRQRTEEGAYETLVAVPDARKALEEIQSLPKADQERAYAEGVHILLATAAGQTDVSLAETAKTRGALEHALPMASLASIQEENVFEAQAQILIEELLRIQRLPEFGKDRFYLTGGFTTTQSAVLESLIEKNGLASMVIVGEPEGKAAVVRYIDTAKIASAPVLNTGEIQFPVTGFEKDQIPAWYSAIREAGAVGGVYAAHFDGQKIRFDEVKADALPEQAFQFHNTHAVKRLLNLLQWKNVLEGRVTLDQFKEASFYMPLQRIAVDLLIRGARLALQSIGKSA